MPTVADRFAQAAARPPLSALSPASQHELGMVLARSEAFEDLPGKWQAALLEAESAAPPREAGGSCCAGVAAPAARAAAPGAGRVVELGIAPTAAPSSAHVVELGSA